MRKLAPCLWIFLVIPLAGGTCGTSPIGAPLPLEGYDGNWKIRFNEPSDPGGTPPITMCLKVEGGTVVEAQDACRITLNIVSSTPLSIDTYAQLSFSFSANGALTDGTTYNMTVYFTGTGNAATREGMARFLFKQDDITLNDIERLVVFTRN